MPSKTVAGQLLDALVASKKITEDIRAEVEKRRKGGTAVEDALRELKAVDDETVAKTKAAILGVPYADLVGKEILPDVLNMISRQVAENARAVGFQRKGDALLVGMIDPKDLRAVQSIDFLGRQNNFIPKYHIISPASYAYVLKRYDFLGKEVARALEVAKEKYVPAEPKPGAPEQTLEQTVKGAPVSRIVSVILQHAVEGNASDIHIEPYGKESRVRYRVDGVLHTSLTLPQYIHGSVVSRIKVLAGLKIDETRIPQDGRITETFDGKLIDFRISTLPLTDSEKVVIRVLDTTKGVPTLNDLGFRPEFQAMILKEIKKPHGMFLIVGPTGSGKSTTLFTILSMRNEEGVNISTLEDPVEYFIRGINQSQVRPEIGFTFANGIRALLRQDPNVMMVGEIRDSETAELAVHAALTGHLVFSTLHTNDAFGVVPRLIDMHIEPFLLQATLNMVVSQRLARKICERCKAKTELPEEVETKVRSILAELPAQYAAKAPPKGTPLQVWKGRGCLRCGDTGYYGRVAVAECLPFGDDMATLITKGFHQEDVREVAKAQNMLTIQQDGLLKALEGLTTIEEIMRISTE